MKEKSSEKCKHKLHNSGLFGETLITFDGEPDMFVHYMGENDCFGFWTTGKCIHCGKQLLTKHDIENS